MGPRAAARLEPGPGPPGALGDDRAESWSGPVDCRVTSLRLPSVRSRSGHGCEMEVGAGSSLLYSPQISSTAGWGRTARRDYRESSAERDGHIANRSFALVGTMVVIPVNLPYARRATDCRAGRARLGAGPQAPASAPPPHTPVAPRRALQTDESTREPRAPP